MPFVPMEYREAYRDKDPKFKECRKMSSKFDCGVCVTGVCGTGARPECFAYGDWMAKCEKKK